MGFFFDKDIKAKVLDGKSSRKVLAHCDDVMACHLFFEQGGRGTLHSHPHTQICYVISGVFDFTLSVTSTHPPGSDHVPFLSLGL